VTSFLACRLTVLDVGANGVIRVLFPNREGQNVQVQPMQTVVVSGPSSPLTLEASPPGQKQVVAICTADPADTAEDDGNVEQTVAAGTPTAPVANEVPGPVKPAETTAVAAVSLSIYR
jgi:hypothetical protein